LPSQPMSGPYPAAGLSSAARTSVFTVLFCNTIYVLAVMPRGFLSWHVTCAPRCWAGGYRKRWKTEDRQQRMNDFIHIVIGNLSSTGLSRSGELPAEYSSICCAHVILGAVVSSRYLKRARQRLETQCQLL
jgi:hypothetical protein